MGSFRDLASPRALGVLFPIGLFVAAWSGWRIWDERALLGRAIEVPATIESSSVEDWTSGTGTSRERHFRPVVRFVFELGGKSHVADRVTPLGDSGSSAWARELAARFHPGQSVIAWADPGSPGHAFLVQTTSWKPPVGVGVGLLIALATGAGLVRRRKAAPAREAA